MPSPESSGPPPRASVRILLVDDDPLITHLIVDTLNAEGYRVDTAANGLVALEKFQPGRYDVILSDLHMPELDGAGLYRALTERQGRPPDNMIFLTGTAGSSESHRVVQETRQPVLRKPFNLVDLVQLVRQTLKRK